MASWQSLARSRSDVSEAGLAHLGALIADWSILADLGFSDLVLYVPTWSGSGFVAIAQVRPDTVPTRIPFDVVGTFVPRGRLPEVDRAWASGSLVADRPGAGPRRPADREAIPVVLPAAQSAAPARAIAVVARYPGVRHRTLGDLEDAYLAAADELGEMTAVGAFPAGSDLPASSPARVGDGFVRIDAGGAVRFASPNAQSAMRALGLSTSLLGADLARTLARLTARPGPQDRDVAAVASAATAGSVEVEGRTATLVLRGIPLHRGGGIVLLRDVTEIRQRERALVSKDATIREIHHRVKNNLQTVAALLRLQSRRVPDATAKEALADAMQRVNAIAVVHESLSQGDGDVVAFDEVVDRVLAGAADTARVHARAAGPPTLQRVGEFGPLPAQIATPLAMCLNELVLNAAEHAGATRIEVVARRTGRVLDVVVDDDGVGMERDPAGKDLAGSRVGSGSSGLGLPIVDTLVRDQLGATLEWDAAGRGTSARIRVPLAPPVDGR